MSTDYQIFLEELDEENDLHCLSTISGVTVYTKTEVAVEGLCWVRSTTLSPYSKSIMRDEFGEFGLSYDWKVIGTYDPDYELYSVLRRLFLCTAALVNIRPQRNVSLMRNGESIYVYNNHERLIICPYFTEEMPDLPSLFNRRCEIFEIEPWGN